MELAFEQQQQAEAGPSRPPVGANKVSCSACRAAKCKCIEADGDQCARCQRLGIECVFRAHQRGRPRKDGAVPGSAASAGRPSPRSSPAALQPPAKRARTSGVSFGALVPTSNERYSLSSPSRSPSVPAEEPPANSVYHDVAHRSIFSIAGVMEREKAVEDAAPTPTRKDDPIGQGVLSMDECDSLFGHYFDQLQTCVCLLDPAVHTARYTRRASLHLFAAVLAVSSKFFRPDLYETILAIANKLVSDAIGGCVAQIELVQAICLLHYWKKPTDGSGWLRLGHAIRLGYALDLHLPRSGPLPTDEREARLAIDRERTWISLFCFDSTMTQLSDRPSMIHKAPQVSAWIRDNPYTLPSDGQLDFAVKTSTLSSEVRQLQSCKGNYEVLRSGLRMVLDDLHRSHKALTDPDAPLTLTSTSVSINKFSTLATQLLVECTSLYFAPRKHRVGLLHACVSTSLDLLDVVVEGFARKGIMPMIEDAHSVAVASTAVRLIRFMSYLDQSAKASVMRKLTKVVIVCREAARGDQGSHPAYLARFIHALLEKAHASRAPSRATSPRGPARTLSAAEMSPLKQKTTPDQWWDEIGHMAYAEAPQPFEEQQNFWDGFPLLAGAMSGLSPAVPRVEDGGVDLAGAFSGLQWDSAWDLSFLGVGTG